MAGHSHWANIAHKKGRIDASRGKLFGKLARLIIVAAKRGGDPSQNLALRYAIDRAKAQSMPNDTIDRAIKKGTGELGTDSYDEVIYEGYGPEGVAVMCEILTENRNRTAGEIRKIFERHGGNLGSTGCVAWMFERVGLFSIPAKNVSEETLMEVALENGATDIRQQGDDFEVVCPPDQFSTLAEVFQQRKIPVERSEITRIAENRVDLDVETGRQVLKLMEALDDNDDVQNVTANFNLPEALIAELNADD